MDYKKVFRKLDETLADIAESGDPVAATFAMLTRLVDDLGDELGLTGGRIYARRGPRYVLQREYPAGRVKPGFEIPASYAPMKELVARGSIVRDIKDPGVDADLERKLGVRTFAAISVGDRAQQIMAFSLKRRSDPEEVLHTLNTIRHVVNLKLRQARLEGRVTETRAIQMSLLPREAPAFEGFDVWAQTVPAEEVGGDLYDFIPVSEHVLGFAVADAAGHGLPAALQARDAIVGLRMGVEERMRITATVEKLNRVVSRSSLASKFISLFYGEIDRNGTLVYCNAGHPPPLLLRGRRIQDLSRHGLVLGPSPDARYPRGYVELRPGDVLLAYTDGIVEAPGSRGRRFGVDALRKILRSRSWSAARSLVQTVFDEVEGFSGSDMPEDDQTVVALIRTDDGFD